MRKLTQPTQQARNGFTPDDLQRVIAVAQEAPLANMKAASALSNLLQRMQIWAHEAFNHECPVPDAAPEQEVPAGTSDETPA